LRVIGAGFGRTGTTSLKAALETLGLDPCYHMTEVFAHPRHAEGWRSAWRGEPVDWDAILGPYEAAVDWPACTFYEELDGALPGSEGAPQRPRPGALVREHPDHHLRVEPRTRGLAHRARGLRPRQPPRLRRVREERGRRGDHLEWHLRRPLRGQNPRDRSPRTPQRRGQAPRPARTPARLRGQGRLGTLVRVPRGARSGRAVPAPERRGRDAARHQGASGALRRGPRVHWTASRGLSCSPSCGDPGVKSFPRGSNPTDRASRGRGLPRRAVKLGA
jgi:hypothetical protein